MPRYANPVLDADWPDPDVIRVDDAYYLVASSFNRVPGLPILRSTNLVDWEIVSHALPELPPAEQYALPRHGCGVWAPSIRHHDGRFVVVYPDPDYGLFVVSSESAEGLWTAPYCLVPGQGLIDPCPLFDDDGRAYLVFGWARSRAGIANRLSVIEVEPDLSAVIGAPQTVIDGDDLPGFRTLEGPKFYRRGGWYWIFAPAGGVETGWQSVFRSRSVWGPYEERRVLEQGSTPVNGPHQGGWVTAADGSDWFLHFQDRGCFGRVVHLQPMTWRADGWPVFGAAGEPVPGGVGPGGDVPGPERDASDRDGRVGPSAGEPCRDDDFAAASKGADTFAPGGDPIAGLNRWWHWAANPEPGWHQVGEGALRLQARVRVIDDLRQSPQLLAQQLPGQPATITTSVALEGAGDGLRAGLVVLGATYQWVGLARRDGRLLVVVGRSDRAGQEYEAEVIDPADPKPSEGELNEVGLNEVGLNEVGLGAHVDPAGIVRFSCRLGEDWLPIGPDYQAEPGRWIGAEVGLFADRLLGSEPAAARFGPWRVRPDRGEADPPRVAETEHLTAERRIVA
ncbi:glycosyl hydrolase 43 family protein [Microlunatus elymi]|uniref:Glycosyl hydrolase 43 family protein n=1 Tax=Microlunatus elymi TaxID=2596828 RepID=A0A516Q0L3_9ACTN|nr:glycoside hydrolase 43 family protein [Microlunatus elymi]QDP96741.1 glycosyl hydrolase 43 family protein [Microlunatus elymi]